LRPAVTTQVSAITAFRLITRDADRLAPFYRGLGFVPAGREPIPDAEMGLLDLQGGGIRTLLRLGEQRLELDTFTVPGRPYPTDTTAADLCFQHLALVTDDAAAAWRRVAVLGATPISTHVPVMLPPTTGVTAAVKFRDPEGHPLELLQFPPDGPDGKERWAGKGLLGIDHSALSVSDAAVSRRFYECLGLAIGRPTLNEGPTQRDLDGLADVEVDVIPMLPPQNTPHVELLGYRKPVGRPARRLAANDVAATRIVWAADRDALLRDPDGHLHQCSATVRLDS
jgi:catechol 2,3-dioxygenase-like lactoylglutathione lyase family enzyme